ncbi:Clr5 domain-containing protein [Apiospora arundinis]|uniref:Clr5 domain-containing protein n=1 Tax=Apiospora arundinis TaxID=335852 RepID=A0ABR2JCQ4_9PEZI
MPMMQEPVGDRWATPNQWERYRTTISWLYRRKTLGEIMQIMQQEHGFYATARMYKLRIRTWGLRKNLGFEEAKGILERMIGRQHPPNGEWNVSLSYVYSYIQRLPSGRREVLMQLYDQVVAGSETALSKPHSPSPPLPPHLNVAPGTGLRGAEECNHHLRSYILGGFSNRWWSQDMIPQPHVTELLIEWYHISVVVHGALQRKQTVQAFQVLQPFFDQHSVVLKSRDPRIFGTTIAFVLVLSASGPEIGTQALRFSAHLTGTRYGEHHPYRAALQQLAYMSAEEHRHWLPTIMDWYYRFLGDQAEPGGPFQSYIDYCRRAAKSFVRRIDSSTGHRDEYSNLEVSQDLDEISRTMCIEAEANSPESDDVKTEEGQSGGDGQDMLGEGEGRQHVAKQHATGLRDDLTRLSVLTDLEQALAHNPNKQAQRNKVRQELDLLLNTYCARLTS